jgi:hypothetical protein
MSEMVIQPSVGFSKVKLALDCPMDDGLIKLLDDNRIPCFECCLYFKNATQGNIPLKRLSIDQSTAEAECVKCKGTGIVELGSGLKSTKKMMKEGLKKTESRIRKNLRERIEKISPNR